MSSKSLPWALELKRSRIVDNDAYISHYNERSDHSNFKIKVKEQLRDCHAEILAKRALLRYFQEKVLALFNGNEGSSIFQFTNNDHQTEEPALRLQLKDKIKFHMYSSSQPCGNASIKKWAKGVSIVPNESLKAHEYPIDIHRKIDFQAKAEGQIALTCKRDGHGDHKSDDIADSTRPLPPHLLPSGLCSITSQEGYIMSCSDKIAKWNALGIQGSGFSHLLDKPIYLTTFTIGRKFGKPYGERAFCCRLQDFTFPFTTTCKSKKRSRRTDNCNEEKETLLPDAPVLYYKINHPTILCSSKTFDNSVIITEEMKSTDAKDEAEERGNDEGDDETAAEAEAGTEKRSKKALKKCIGANFDEYRCLVWFASSFHPKEKYSAAAAAAANDDDNDHDVVDKGSLEVLDGRTGYLYNEVESSGDKIASSSALGSEDSSNLVHKVSEISGSNLSRVFLQLIGRLYSSCSSSSSSSLLLSRSSAAEESTLIANIPQDGHSSANKTNKDLSYTFLGERKYEDAKLLLLSSPLFFNGWLHS
jgi:double-stranded RNA-specific adenosine deaminase